MFSAIPLLQSAVISVTQRPSAAVGISLPNQPPLGRFSTLSGEFWLDAADCFRPKGVPRKGRGKGDHMGCEDVAGETSGRCGSPVGDSVSCTPGSFEPCRDVMHLAPSEEALKVIE